MNQKLLNIQKGLVCPKNQFNSFGNYKYRSCEDILTSIKPLLAKEGLTLTISDAIEVIGNRNYVKATALLTDNELTTISSAYAKEAESQKGMSDPQLTGSASSYARKYALCGLFLIDDGVDPDSQDNTNIVKSTKTHPTQSSQATTGDGKPSFKIKNPDDPASPQQLKMLKSLGITKVDVNITKEEASKKIGEILDPIDAVTKKGIKKFEANKKLASQDLELQFDIPTPQDNQETADEMFQNI